MLQMLQIETKFSLNQWNLHNLILRSALLAHMCCNSDYTIKIFSQKLYNASIYSEDMLKGETFSGLHKLKDETCILVSEWAFILLDLISSICLNPVNVSAFFLCQWWRCTGRNLNGSAKALCHELYGSFHDDTCPICTDIQAFATPLAAE